MLRGPTFLRVLIIGVGMLSADLILPDTGRLEINQACVADGCFAGDTAGFPIQISASGSYVLTSDLVQAVANIGGISIQSDDVTLDLNGFTISGPGTVAGVGVSIAGDRVVVSNGSVLNFGGGINFSGAGDGDASRVHDVVITTESAWAVRLGENSEIRNCTVTAGATAVTAFRGAHIVGNRIVVDTPNANAHGIEALGDSIVRDNIIVDATGHGIYGSSNSIFDSNTVRGSGQSGIYAIGGRSIFSGNNVSNSQNYGFEFAGAVHHLIRGNAASNNNLSSGIFTDYDTCATCTFIDNHVP